MLPCFLFKISAAGKTPVIPRNRVVRNPVPCYNSEWQIGVYREENKAKNKCLGEYRKYEKYT